MEIILNRLEAKTYYFNNEDIYNILTKYYASFVPYGCSIHLDGEKGVIRDSFERDTCSLEKYEMLEALNTFLPKLERIVEDDKKRGF
ncbi:hypothetical protein LAX75_13050 [Listeria cossartiae]|uniref:hypothetical protein n=1 Tax=Listeria cossartiae TaxID=2838249 RepID=UPI001E634940|nr:hypothetical protein [Listeria cossartiae]MCD2225543.1 hypothetical protein [Listeria cossartiae]MCD2240294.1 hypothetical protein [Listeria cossartiae]